jgi:hypothetical protein
MPSAPRTLRDNSNRPQPDAPDQRASHQRAILAATSQKVIKVSLIHLDGETAADVELSPRLRDAIVEIVNHHMTARKGAWGWTLQEINGPERRGQKVTMEDPAHPRGADSRKSKAA